MGNERHRGESPQDGQNDLERELATRLTEGEMERANPTETARRMLSPKYEIRIQAELDPVVEEILRFRQIAREVDDRYDKYLERALRRRQSGEWEGPAKSGSGNDSRHSGTGNDEMAVQEMPPQQEMMPFIAKRDTIPETAKQETIPENSGTGNDPQNGGTGNAT